jgi:phenylpropionate dioxygenase-like ring-hydroxylating dioxygenase large terminal subunit
MSAPEGLLPEGGPLTNRVAFHTPPMLPDGLVFADLIDEERRRVDLRVLADEDLHQLDLEYIFARAWVMLAHESELPTPGSFVTRWIGSDSVIVSRDSTGSFNVMLNACAHRGMPLCRTDRGDSSQFKCPYHGWVFNNKGSFLAAPFEKEMYGDMDKPSLGLKRARVGTYAGVIFATWDEEAPELVDYLGDIAWYLDIMLSRTDSGLEVVGAPQRFIINANWKAASEQWAGDGYHAMTLHHSLTELGLADYSRGSWAINVCTKGHVLRCSANPKKFWGGETAGQTLSEQLRDLPPPGTTVDMLDQVVDHMTESQLKIMIDTPPVVGQIFPNFFVWNSHGKAADGTISSITRFHTTVPRGPDTLELLSWALVERDAPQEVKDIAKRTSVLMTGISGFIEQDDAETWPAMTRAAQGVIARTQTLKYIAVLGEHRPDDWGGGGSVFEGFSKDDAQWSWWVRYREFMNDTAW